MLVQPEAHASSYASDPFTLVGPSCLGTLVHARCGHLKANAHPADERDASEPLGAMLLFMLLIRFPFMCPSWPPWLMHCQMHDKLFVACGYFGRFLITPPKFPDPLTLDGPVGNTNN
jgi:hypothetical protein